jgi:hypothetical protein
MTSILSSFYVKQITASNDEAFTVEDEVDIVLTSVNIHCYTNDAYYGNAGSVLGIIRADAVIWFDSPCRVSDLVFKNLTAGSNCTIVITGTMAVK